MGFEHMESKGGWVAWKRVKNSFERKGIFGRFNKQTKTLSPRGWENPEERKIDLKMVTNNIKIGGIV